MTVKKALGCFGTVTLFAILGWLVALFLSIAYTGGFFHRWVDASLPENQAAEAFILAEGPYAYVTARDERVFAFPLDPQKPRRWQVVFLKDEIETRNENTRWDCRVVDEAWLTLYRPPGRTREWLVCTYEIFSYHEFQGSTTYTYRFVIQDNGEIWRWETFGSAWRSLGYLLQFSPYGIIGGAILGLIAFGILSRMTWSRSRRESVAATISTPSFPQRRESVRRSQPFICPHCGHESRFDPNVEAARCPKCGYRPQTIGGFVPSQRQTLGISRRCERCGREIGRELLTCMDRASGYCPFTLETGDASEGCLKLLGLGMLFYAVVMVASMFNPEDETRSWILAAICLPILIFMGSGLLFGKRQTLHNQATGQFWQRHTIFGIETDRKLVTGLERPTYNLFLPEPFDDPVSIVALEMDTHKPTSSFQAWTKYATDVFTATLVGMLAEGSIEVRYARTQRSYLMSPYFKRDEYLIIPGESSNPKQAHGYLEERILLVVKNKRPYYTPQGIGIYDMVYAVYESDQSAPGRWLVHRIMEDAAERGLGNITGSGRKMEYQPGSGYSGRLKQQSRTLQSLCDQLGKSHPSLMTAFRLRIPRAIQARTPDTTT